MQYRAVLYSSVDYCITSLQAVHPYIEAIPRGMKFMEYKVSQREFLIDVDVDPLAPRPSEAAAEIKPAIQAHYYRGV